MIYLDTTALVKLLFDEPESVALANWLTLKTTVAKVTSDISLVEVMRTCRRIDEPLVEGARRLLDGIDLVPLNHTIIQQAAALTSHELRSLDAIHLASALSLRDDITDFVAYDPRLCSAAAKVGLPIVSPMQLSDS